MRDNCKYYASNYNPKCNKTRVMYVNIHFCELNINECIVKCNLIVLFDDLSKKSGLMMGEKKKWFDDQPKKVV